MFLPDPSAKGIADIALLELTQIHDQTNVQQELMKRQFT